ncbi:hypothetical protein J6590_105025 [Homalodisca vitripennis]|nr:hypothetical protein J6590_105025 [Homalodisca vitripennis]
MVPMKYTRTSRKQLTDSRMTVNSSIHQDITGQSSGVTMTEVPYRNEAGGGGESRLVAWKVNLGNVDQTTSLSPTSQRTTSGSGPVHSRGVVLLQFTFLLVQRLQSDAISDLTPGIWIQVRPKRS